MDRALQQSCQSPHSPRRPKPAINSIIPGLRQCAPQLSCPPRSSSSSHLLWQLPLTHGMVKSRIHFLSAASQDLFAGLTSPTNLTQEWLLFNIMLLLIVLLLIFIIPQSLVPSNLGAGYHSGADKEPSPAVTTAASPSPWVSLCDSSTEKSDGSVGACTVAGCLEGRWGDFYRRCLRSGLMVALSIPNATPFSFSSLTITLSWYGERVRRGERSTMLSYQSY